MKKIAAFFVVISLLFISVTGYAQVKKGAFNISPTIGMYTFLRFFVEYFRADSFPVMGDITLAQVTVATIATICASAVLIILTKRKK